MNRSRWKFETNLHFVSNTHTQATFEPDGPCGAAASATLVSYISIQFCPRFMCVNINAGLVLYCGNSCNIYRL